MAVHHDARILITTAWLVAACNPSHSNGSSGSSGDATDSSVFETLSGSGVSASSGSAESGDELRFDMGPPTDTPNTTKTCQKIDFVFVVDNSKSMSDEQEQLVAAVSGFVESMKTALPSVEDFRVGVVDTDSYPGVGTPSNPLDACPTSADCDACEYQLGAFLSRPDSAEDMSKSCDFSTGLNYMDGQSDAFGEEFECAAVVGIAGNPTEQQVGALVEAVSPTLNGADGCNEGFIRDEALLVFLVITDEEDDHDLPPGPPYGGSLGSPSRWYEAIVEAKHGKPTNVVALALTGGSPKFTDCPDLGTDNEGAEEATRIGEFIDLFDTKFIGSVCSDGYNRFFTEALAAIEEGCMSFIP